MADLDQFFFIPRVADSLFRLAGENDTVVLGLEPLHGVLLGEAVGETDVSGLAPPVPEVHAVDTNARVILDAQVDVLLHAEPEVAVVGEVALPQLVLQHFEPALKNLLSLGAADGAVDRDLLVPPDAERSDSVAGFGKHWGLPGQ